MFEDYSSANDSFSNSYTGLNLTNFPGRTELSDIIAPMGANSLPGTGAMSSANLLVAPLSTITIVASDKTAAETLAGLKPNVGGFTLTRTNDITTSLSVTYSIGGTATNGLDYDSLTGIAIFDAGSSTSFINLNPIDDNLFEGKETVQLILQSDASYTLGNAKSAAVNITDNDKPTISIIASDFSAVETAPGAPSNPGQFTLSRSGNTSASLSVSYLMSGAAVNGQDYDSLTGSVTFAAGSSTAVVNINPINDGVNEGSEAVTLTLKSNKQYILDQNNSATISINDPSGGASTTDWFSQNLKDTGLANLTRALAADGQLNRSDVISILRDAEDNNTVDTYEFTDLKTIINNAAKFSIQGYVLDLFDKVTNGDLANQNYQGGALGNLFAGSSNTQMENLIGKWFLGSDHPLSKYAYQYFSQPLFANGISPDDVSQGQVGDCYFLATLASIANEQPQYIQDMFIDNGDNTFTVRFFNKGVADYVTVDRFLPKANWGAAYANATSEMWVALAEKAYAQLAESHWSRSSTSTNAYDSISGGWMSNVIPQVTALGAVSKSVTSTTKAQLIALSNSTSLLTVGFVYGTVAGSGIVNSHAYTITSYNAVTDTFFLRNPWGTSHVSVTWDQLVTNQAIFNWSA